MRIMITGGGTGGHVFPAVAVAEELHRRDPHLALQWVGRRGNIEERVCERLSIPFRSVSVLGWPRNRGLRQVGAMAALGRSLVQAFVHVRKFRPQAVFAVGGYVSLPVAYVANRMGILVLLHEHNRQIGMANRILAPRATRILLSFSDTKGEFPEEKAILVGNPVRAEFFAPPSKGEACRGLGLDESIPVVLIVGGSQGAHRLNEAVADVLSHVRENEAQFLWITGTADAAAARKAADGAVVPVHVFSFLEDMVAACAASDIVVSRAGASLTAEIAAMGKPGILVPYPHAAEGHQDQNARAFEERGAAIVLPDHECTGRALLTLLRDLLADAAVRDAMGKAAASLAKPGAAERIADEILSLVFAPASDSQSDR